jgi:CxxC motif-containing protein (DUF1111 family)
VTVEGAVIDRRTGSRRRTWPRGRIPGAWALAGAWLLAAATGACADGGGDAAAVEPGEWLPGGSTSNTLLTGDNAFAMPAANIDPEHEGLFFTGNSFFNQAWVQAPASTAGRDGLGPLFNARSCAACHFRDGRGRPPLDPEEPFLGMLLRLSIPGSGARGEPVPDPAYGGQLQPFAVLEVAAEGQPRVRYRERRGSHDDGAEYSLLEPTYWIEAPAYGPPAAALRISPRVAPAVIGLGLLEAIPLGRLEELADPEDADADGISGRINRVWDAAGGAHQAGRFGWKAEQPSVRQQAAGAFLGDMGITTSLFPDQDCTEAQAACRGAMTGGAPEIPDRLLDRVVLYSQLLAVPARQGWDAPEVLRGKRLFTEAGCAGCHVPRHETGALAGLPEVSGQIIWPYTDLLLHDMGPELSDERPVFAAGGSEWRTPPLWGIGHLEVVNGHDRLLHDGRARGIAEAILWHGGEAEAAREAFRRMSAADRQALVTFVRSL